MRQKKKKIRNTNSHAWVFLRMCSHFSQSVSRVWKPGAVSRLLEHMSHTDVACHGNVSDVSSLRRPGVLFFDRPIWRTRNWQFPAIRRQPRRVSAERSRKQGLLLRTSLTLTGHTSPVRRVCGGSCVCGGSQFLKHSVCVNLTSGRGPLGFIIRGLVVYLPMYVITLFAKYWNN